MLASEVIKALRESGVLYTEDPERRARARAMHLPGQDRRTIAAGLDQVALDVAGREPEADGLNGILHRVVQMLTVGVKDEPLYDLLVDPSKFGFAVEDLDGRFNARSFAIGDAWLALIDRALMVGAYGTARAICGRIHTNETSEAELPACETCGNAACAESSVGVSSRRWFESGVRMHFAKSQVWEDWSAPRDRLVASDGLATSAEAFVVAHEIAHHLYGHTTQGYVKPSVRPGAADSIREFLPSWEMELQADRGASELVIYAAAGGDFDRPHEQTQFVNAALGIEHFWCTAELLERTATTPVEHDTHPPISVRRFGIDYVYRQNPSFEVLRRAVAGYRALHQSLWRTLASPSEHDIAGWARERAAVRLTVARLLKEIAGVLTGEYFKPRQLALTKERFDLDRWSSSKLFFDSEVLRLARSDSPTDPLVRAAQLAWVRWCDTPEVLASRVDHKAPFLGVPTHNPTTGFAELFDA